MSEPEGEAEVRSPESPPAGLSLAEAQRRLAQYGYNELPEKETSVLRRLLVYFDRRERGLLQPRSAGALR